MIFVVGFAVGVGYCYDCWGLVVGDWFCIVRLIDCGLIVLVFGLLL